MHLKRLARILRPLDPRRDPAQAAAIIVFICSGLPLAWMLLAIVRNLNVRSEISLDAFRVGLLYRTLAYNGLAAIIATAMGIPAGIVLGRGRGWIAQVCWVVIPSALLLPSLSYAYGWAQFTRIIGDHLGGVTDNPFFAVGGPADTLRCIWTLAAWLWAVPAVLIGSSLRRMDTSVQQQALLDGASRRIMFRQLSGAIIASLAIVTILATQEFSVYEKPGISVVATEVRMVFDSGALSSPTNGITAFSGSGEALPSPDQAGRAAAAVATALVLIVITFCLAWLALRVVQSTTAVDALGVGDWPRVLDASKPAVVITVVLVLINVALPITTLYASLAVPLSAGKVLLEFAPKVWGSMLIGLEVAMVAIIGAFSYGGGRLNRGDADNRLLIFAGMSFLIGGQLLAIGMMRIFNHPMLYWVYDTSLMPVLAYVGRFGWLAIAAGRQTRSRPWWEVRDMAAVDGASSWQSARSILWPLAWPTLLAGALLVAALSLTEVPATVLLQPQNPQVLTPMLMTWVHMMRSDPMIEASLLMIAMVLVPALAAVLFTNLGIHVTRRLLK